MFKTVKLILLLCISQLVLSQDNNQWKVDMAIADSFMKIGVYYDAIDYYELAIQQENLAVLHFKKGKACMHARDYLSASIHFEKTLELGEQHFPKARYFYALMNMYLGNYKLASDEFIKLKSDYEGPNKEKIKKWAAIELEGCAFAIKDSLDTDRKPLSIEHLPKPLNRGNSDFAAFENDGELYFSSFDTDSSLQFFGGTNTNCRIYRSKRLGTDQYSEKTRFDKIIPELDEHIANGCFSPAKTMFVYSVCKKDKHGIIKCKLHAAEISFSQEWIKTRVLPNHINVPNYTTTQPTMGISENGNEILYYASDRPGGLGGMDIWYAELKKNGTFGYPKNCGRKINTNRDEISPHYIEEEMKLAFSSNGKSGFGGFDIYTAGGNLRKFEKATNIGTPVNSSYDDIYYFSENNQGYFSSNRPGGFNDKFPTCCDDIYYFTKSKAHNLISRGKLFAKVQLDNIAFKVALYTIDNTDHSEILIKHEDLNSEENYKFYVQSDRYYRIKAFAKDKKNYYTGSKEFNTLHMNKSQLVLHDIEVKKYKFNKEYILEDVRFDSKSLAIKPEFKKQLDELTVFVSNNADLIIEISAHTDNTGDENNNLKLSQKRADAILEYLKQNGYHMDLSHLVAKGYGSSQPKGDNNTNEGRAINRRCEFKIVGQEIK
jgi:outer membrane protein OmpA-like peptidoglycan-associated protein